MRPIRSTPPTIPATAVPRRRRGGRRRILRHASLVGACLASAALVSSAFPGVASAATDVNLGAAAPFAVLAGSGISDVPTSTITGDVGLSPATGADITGLGPLEVHGTIYTTDGTGPAGNVNDPALLTNAKNDLSGAYTTASNDSATNSFNAGDNQLGGQTLTPGVYSFAHAANANITAAQPLTLSGNGVFVLQAASDLITASGSVVQLTNGAQACHVYWVVRSSATLGSSSTFVGTLMALTSATLDTGATVQGRILAENALVTLDANTITTPSACTATTVATVTPTTTAGTTATGVVGPGGASTTPGSTTPTSAYTGSGGTAAGATPGAGAATSAAVVPSGSPATGLGGSAHGPSPLLIGLGALGLAGASGAASLAVVRRRRYTSRT